MNVDIRTEQLTQLLEGKTRAQVAEAYGISRQSIALLLKLVCPWGARDSKSKPAYHGFDEETCKRIAKALAVARGDIAAACSVAMVDEETILKATDYILARKPNKPGDCVYPALATWMRVNIMPVDDLAAAIDVPPRTLSVTLGGKRHLDLALARKLQRATGLSLRDIYGPFNMPAIEAAIKEARPPGVA